jgi:hypothetical protein
LECSSSAQKTNKKKISTAQLSKMPTDRLSDADELQSNQVSHGQYDMPARVGRIRSRTQNTCGLSAFFYSSLISTVFPAALGAYRVSSIR